jgi:hypothetical protein
MKKTLGITLAALLALTAAAAADSQTMLTVYNQDLALVRQVRTIPVSEGDFAFRFEDVTARIDATSVALETLSGPPLQILEQNYAYDLVSDQKVLEKSIGQTVTFFEKYADTEKAFTGRLLSVAGGRPVIQTGEGIYIGTPSRYLLDKLPPGLILKPTLVWLLRSRRAGQQQVALSYLTGGLSWSSNYVLSLSPDEKRAGVTGWVTLVNQSGVGFENATLKLLAGDVNRAQQPQPPRVYMMKGQMNEAAAAPQFQEKSLFEYHLYTLQRPATVADNETKQIELVTAASVPVEKTYVYDGANLGGYGGWYYGGRENRDLGVPSNKKVSVYLSFDNKESAGLGVPLPKGTVRVFQNDSDGSAQFVGEDAIDHTPKDETIRIKLGEAFDIVGERKQTDFKVVVPNHVYDESFAITLRNHKKEPVTVRVVEVLYRWSDWEIRRESAKHEKVDSQTVVFPVSVAPDGETVINYTVRYTW